MIIRNENPADIEHVQSVVETAFGRADEARLIDKLRDGGQTSLSLVADLDHKIIGHLYFSPVTIQGKDQNAEAVGLGPIAVLPHYQKRGIGTAMIRHAFDELHRQGHKLVVVLGEPDYYSRFGFVASNSHGIGCQFDVPGEYMMIAELEPGHLEALGGQEATIVYAPEFSEV